jgi:hypothetical protein
MAFVPEGQADSSQARSAWVAMQRVPRPAGTGYFPHDSRHFVPGYYRAVSGQKPSAYRERRAFLALKGAPESRAA